MLKYASVLRTTTFICTVGALHCNTRLALRQKQAYAQNDCRRGSFHDPAVGSRNKQWTISYLAGSLAIWSWSFNSKTTGFWAVEVQTQPRMRANTCKDPPRNTYLSQPMWSKNAGVRWNLSSTVFAIRRTCLHTYKNILSDVNLRGTNDDVSLACSWRGRCRLASPNGSNKAGLSSFGKAAVSVALASPIAGQKSRRQLRGGVENPTQEIHFGNQRLYRKQSACDVWWTRSDVQGFAQPSNNIPS
jgi:hypothetical protein